MFLQKHLSSFPLACKATPCKVLIAKRYPDKPLWLSEIGSARRRRDLWLTKAIQEAIFRWGIKAIIFFEQNKEHLHWLLENDWKLADKPEVVSHLRPYLDQPVFCPGAGLELIKAVLREQISQ